MPLAKKYSATLLDVHVSEVKQGIEMGIVDEEKLEALSREPSVCYIQQLGHYHFGQRRLFPWKRCRV